MSEMHLPSMTPETFKKGVSDFTKLLEKTYQAELKLAQDNNTTSAWIVGISTGAFIFIFASKDANFLQLIKPVLPFIVILQGLQIFFAVLLRIFIKSYAVYIEKNLIFLNMQELYLETRPKFEELKEHDLFHLYSKLAEFTWLTAPLGDKFVNELTHMKKSTGYFVKWTFILVMLTFLIMYGLFLYSIWSLI